MPIKQDKLEKILSNKFPAAIIEVIDLAGDENHYRVIIKDKQFAGKTRIAQHRIVNEALKELLAGDLHAMQLSTQAL